MKIITRTTSISLDNLLRTALYGGMGLFVNPKVSRTWTPSAKQTSIPENKRTGYGGCLSLNPYAVLPQIVLTVDGTATKTSQHHLCIHPGMVNDAGDLAFAMGTSSNYTYESFFNEAPLLEYLKTKASYPNASITQLWQSLGESISTAIATQIGELNLSSFGGVYGSTHRVEFNNSVGRPRVDVIEVIGVPDHVVVNYEQSGYYGLNESIDPQDHVISSTVTSSQILGSADNAAMTLNIVAEMLEEL